MSLSTCWLVDTLLLQWLLGAFFGLVLVFVFFEGFYFYWKYFGGKAGSCFAWVSHLPGQICVGWESKPGEEGAGRRLSRSCSMWML